MISMDRGANAHNADEACDFTAPLLRYYTVQPQTFMEPFRVGNGIFLPDITFCNVTPRRDPAKNELEHPQNCCSRVSFRNSPAYPPHLTRIWSSVRVSVCVLSFEDLLCGNWVMCSQSGFITWEIQWSIFPYCPCSCPERTSRQPPLILSPCCPIPISLLTSLHSGFILHWYRGGRLFFTYLFYKSLGSKGLQVLG